jgi:hypothetical protein
VEGPWFDDVGTGKLAACAAGGGRFVEIAVPCEPEFIGDICDAETLMVGARLPVVVGVVGPVVVPLWVVAGAVIGLIVELADMVLTRSGRHHESHDATLEQHPV